MGGNCAICGAEDDHYTDGCWLCELSKRGAEPYEFVAGWADAYLGLRADLTTARADLAKARVREWVLLAAATSLESDAHEMMATAEGEDIGGMMAAYGRISGVRDELAAIASPAPPEPDTDGRTDGGCDLFERGPRSPIADCISDGHYQCVECVELSEEGADIRRANEDDGHLRGGESDLDSPSWTEKEGG